MPTWTTNKIPPACPRLALPFIALLFSFLILVSVLSIAITVHINKDDMTDKLIKIIGQQRTLVYKFTSNVNYILLGLATGNMNMALEKKHALDSLSDFFDSIQYVLLNGGSIVFPPDTHLGVETLAPLNDDRTRKLLLKVYQDWTELEHTALLSMRSNSFTSANNSYIESLLDQANVTVEDISAESEYILKKNKHELYQIDLLLGASIGATLLLVLFTGYYVFNRFIKPLDQTVHELHSTTEALRMALDRAENSSHAKSEFLSHMSHELRTPMNAILGYSQLLELDIAAGKPTNQDYVREMLDAGQHLLTLIDEVLDLQKIESGKLDVVTTPTQVSDMIRKCLALISTQAEERHITIVDNVSQKDYIVRADPQRFKQVLLNLLSNAVKYNDEHGHISIGADISDGDKLRIAVTNSGAGISAADIKRLFRPFERLDFKHKVAGTGIGLVICKHLIELMGGHIGVYSDPDNSTTFWIELERLDGA